MIARLILVLTLTCTLAQAAEVHDLASAGAQSIDKLQALLAKDPIQAFSWDEAGRTPLHCAARVGSREAAKLLLIKGALDSSKDREGRTPLDIATQAGHQGVVDLLQRHTAALTHLKEVKAAVEKGDSSELRKLLDAYPTIVNATDALLTAPIHCATKKEIVAILIEKGANLDFAPMFGHTPLGQAAKRGDVEMAALLIEHNANVRQTTAGRVTALHTAASAGHIAVVNLLIAKGAEVSAAEDDGVTPIHLAALNGKKEVVDALRAKGATMDAFVAAALGKPDELKACLKAKPDVITSTLYLDRTLVHWAVLGNSKDVIELLIGKDLSPDTPDEFGATPLDIAAHNGLQVAATALIAAGADVEAWDDDEQSLLHRLARSADFTTEGVRKVFELLVKNGADVNAKNLDGDTPLHLAASQGNKQAAELLISNGAEVNAKNDDGKTPLALAKPDTKYPARTAVADLLRSHGGTE